jgi:hypothetical protein
MLREIETGFVRRMAGAPDLAIYEAIPIISAVSLEGPHGKMGHSTNCALAMKHVTPGRFIVPTTKCAAVGSTGAGL